MAQRGYDPRMGMRAGRGLLALVLGALLTVSLGGVGVIAAPPTPDNPAGSHGEILGVVPARNQANRRPSSAANLQYHSGGTVMHTNVAHAIYWFPSAYTDSAGVSHSGYALDPTYQSTIDGFFRNVAAATATANVTSNVYYSDTQYSDGSGGITNQSTFAGSVVDTNAFPLSGCTDSYTPSICLTNAQLQTEIDRVIGANGLQRGMGDLYFLFTPKGVGSCFDAASTSCAFSQYCAYHSSFTPVGQLVTLYANQPYADTAPAACDAGQHPNGNDADATLSVVSHEHNEAITDPLGNAWFDNQGNENGDKCSWTFGTALGSTATGQYNQVINGGKYYLQREWSNKSGACVLTGQ